MINVQREYYYKLKMRLMEDLAIFPRYRVSKILMELTGFDRMSDCNVFALALCYAVLNKGQALKKAA